MIPLRVDPEVADRVKRLELPFNRYGLDPYGVSQRHLSYFFSFLSWLYKDYFPVRAFGLENIPDQGRGMIICNHSGGIALDAGMVLASVLLEKDPPRLAQGMADKFLNRIPFASLWTSRVGQFTGLPEHAVHLLEDDRLLMVFPEGTRGTAKLYPQRNSLVRFGTGFIRLALQTGSPVVPTAFIGSGDAVPTMWNSRTLGRLVGAPYVPLTPWGVAWPRPVPLEVYYGRPITFEGDGHEDDEVVQGYVAQVVGRISRLIDIGLERRRSGRLSEPFVEPEGAPTPIHVED